MAFADDLGAVALPKAALWSSRPARRARATTTCCSSAPTTSDPFGTFRAHAPGGVELAEGYGVMERHVAVW